MDFSDRFSVPYPTLDLNTLNTLPEATVKTNFPTLAEMINMVKRHSVLLTKKTRTEIYYAIVDHADPRIGLVLAAARDNSGNQLFGSLDIVKEFMFGIATTETQLSNVNFRDHEVFIDGIRRVSSALAAATILGQLAQVPEQQAHSVHLEKEALKDLDRILQVPALEDLLRAKDLVKEDSPIKSFYFTPGLFTLTGTLTMELYISGGNNWITVNTYDTEVNTATLIADLADSINSITLISTNSNLVAAPVLAAHEELHRLDFATRERYLHVTHELISVRLTYSDITDTLPFTWGIQTNELQPYTINSLILVTQQAKVTSLSAAREDAFDLSVLYFRQIEGEVPTSNTIEYRISPTMTENTTISVPSTPADDRASGAATALLNDLFEQKEFNKVLGAIIHNDPITETFTEAGIKLVAYTVSREEIHFILDIIKMPNDLEIALGNHSGPITTFSSKPKSITVKTTYDEELALYIDTEGLETDTVMVASKSSSLVQRMQDIRDAQYIYYRPNRYQQPIPPEVTDVYRYHPKRHL